jgi:hypothetical protein
VKFEKNLDHAGLPFAHCYVEAKCLVPDQSAHAIDPSPQAVCLQPSRANLAPETIMKEHSPKWVNTLMRSSAQVFCALVALQCIGCGSRSVPSPEDLAQVDPLGQTSAARESAQSLTPPVASSGTSQTAAQDALQAEARNPEFDWLKFTKPGDVTQEILPYVHNGELNLGTGKITASGAIKLIKAEIQSGKLLLTLQMNQPKQQVRFEGLQGALGTYHPRGRRRRPVSIRGASHEEQFVLPASYSSASATLIQKNSRWPPQSRLPRSRPSGNPWR